MTAADPHRPLRLGVLISGEGTSLQNLIDRIADGRMQNATIAVVISSNTTAGGIARAAKAGIHVEVIRVKDHADVDAFSRKIVDSLDRHRVDVAVQAGWLCYWRLPTEWLGRALNVHPALLPDFGGKGMYGHHVHEAVLAARRPTSGATVHFVDNVYDHGKIIAQEKCEVRPDDTPDTLAARVQAIERELLPRAIEIVRANLKKR